MSETTDDLTQRMDELSIQYEVFACDPELADTAEFCEAYGFGLEESANTILVVAKSNKSEPLGYAACVVLATDQLDVNSAVRKKLRETYDGAKKASFAPSEETVELTGMMVGGVTPVGLPAGLPIWIDERVVTQERVVVGGGSRDAKFILSPKELEKLPDAEVSLITKLGG